ncbi:hypothetical protein [Evansella cellulosilytica]|uniref:Uncharacterized protein n=1 Tax=Evansella cellulosilytica (strain ATCC 21833 / DSM 2522 / FERM P-1141 / JCM 9156 / N-4) TaxID=649639 RepID=E6TRT2_EVAC2|nr:hypothetical protein [Evansella cellulosilytica]ADU29455.1 hypothetical protein Bcell_1190 [Evansella cellulosilytica DSM 2522]
MHYYPTYYPNYYHPYLYYRQNNDYPYPPVDIEQFQKSLEAYQQLVKDGETVLNKLHSSPDLMYRLMHHAQAGNDVEVDKIVKETGVATVVNTSYTPMSVTFTLHAEAPAQSRCCTLTMNLRWG